MKWNSSYLLVRCTATNFLVLTSRHLKKKLSPPVIITIFDIKRKHFPLNKNDNTSNVNNNILITCCYSSIGSNCFLCISVMWSHSSQFSWGSPVVVSLAYPFLSLISSPLRTEAKRWWHLWLVFPCKHTKNFEVPSKVTHPLNLQLTL